MTTKQKAPTKAPSKPKTKLASVHDIKSKPYYEVRTEMLAKRVPLSEWMENPEAFDKKEFVKEFSELIAEVYQEGARQHRHILTMLADQVQIYVDCKKEIDNNGLTAEFNNGKTIGANPAINIQRESIGKILQLMNELGITPKAIYTKTSAAATTAVDFLAGPKVKR